MTVGTVTTGHVGSSWVKNPLEEECCVVTKDPVPIKGSSAVPPRGATSVRPNPGPEVGLDTKEVLTNTGANVSHVGPLATSSAITGGPTINVTHRTR